MTWTSASSSALPPLLLITRHQVKIGVVIALGVVLLAIAGWIVARLLSRRDASDEFVVLDDDQLPFVLDDSKPPESGYGRPVDPAVENMMAPAPPAEEDARAAEAVYGAALRIVTDMGGVSVPAIQRKLNIDFDRATDLVRRMQDDGFVAAGGAAGAKLKVTPEAYAQVERDSSADQADKAGLP